jgi:starch-binding outer membrane protein, SusD/RagB family
MNFNILKKSIFAILTLLFSGCSDDFLDINPTSVLTTEQLQEAVLVNEEVTYGTVNGLYSMMFQPGTGGGFGAVDFGQKGYDIISDMTSSDMALSQSTYNWYYTVASLAVGGDYTNNYGTLPWVYYYKIIRQANLAIETLGGNDLGLDENGEVIQDFEWQNDELKWGLGQARAMRAYGYFYLSQFYVTKYEENTPALPIYTTTNTGNVGLSTNKEVYDLMIKDLVTAKAFLSDFDRKFKHKIDTDVAGALLAYVYAAKKDYLNAQRQLKLIMDAGNFEVTPKDEIVFNGDPKKGGFNNVETQGWMWGVDIKLDYGINLSSFWGKMDIYSYSYQWAGDVKAIDEGLYAQIGENDVRKRQFNTGSPSPQWWGTPSNKFYDDDRELGGQRFVEADNVYMRYSEIVLLYAEMCARLNQDGLAKDALKILLKERINGDYESNIDNITDNEDLLKRIHLETRIELFGEGKSYLAFKRFEASVKRGENHLTRVGDVIEYDSDEVTFEIPLLEVQDNPFID